MLNFRKMKITSMPKVSGPNLPIITGTLETTIGGNLLFRKFIHHFCNFRLTARLFRSSRCSRSDIFLGLMHLFSLSQNAMLPDGSFIALLIDDDSLKEWLLLIRTMISWNIIKKQNKNRILSEKITFLKIRFRFLSTYKVWKIKVDHNTE